MSRRRLLRLGAVGLLSAVATACGATRRQSSGTVPSTAPPVTTSPVTSSPVTTSPAGTSAPTTKAHPTSTAPLPTSVPSTTGAPATTTTTAPGPPTKAEWASLSSGLSGRLSLPDSPGYPVDMELYDPRFDDIKPAAIAFCATAADVARSVTFAREHGLPLAARSGGHSYGGYSTTTGLVVDVSLMSQVTVSDGNEAATVGAGARLIDVYSGLIARGVCVPAGSCPTVGLAGLALGGGIGVLSRLYGLTCDRVTGLEMVTAGGETVRADAATNPELYWACRGGGGGNFGVVTAFDLAPFPVMDVSLFGATWPWAAASQVFPAWLEWVSSAPDELWSNCILSAEPGADQPRVYIGGVWVGSAADAAAQVAALTKVVGAPTDGPTVGENSLGDAMFIEAGCQGLSQAACHLAGKYPGGMLPRSVGVAKSDIVDRPLSTAGVEALLAGIVERQAQGGPGAVAFDSWGGAIGRVSPQATAFVHRGALASAQYGANYGPSPAPADVAGAQSWMDSWYASLRPYFSGQAYQNYIDPGLGDWAQAYYGANLSRLGQVKAKWDPDDIWKFAQSIPLPAGAQQ